MRPWSLFQSLGQGLESEFGVRVLGQSLGPFVRGLGQSLRPGIWAKA